MHLPTRPGPDRKASIGPLLLLGLAVAAVGLSMTGEVLAVDRWKHPPARPGAGQFRAFRQLPNGAGPNAAGPNAAEVNSRAGAIGGEQRREGAAALQGEGRPLEGNRPAFNAVERGGAEPQRLDANPAGRGPELQRQAPGSAAQRGPF